MKHDARAVANRLLDLAEEDGNLLTPMQVLKLVYFCHAWMLAIRDRPLIEQPIEAWQYGPVVRDVYQSFKKHRHDYITSKARVPNATFDADEDDIIEQVYRKYGYLSGIRLSQLAHAPGSPWERVWEANRQNSIIPVGMIKDYYSQKIDKADNGSNTST